MALLDPLLQVFDSNGLPRAGARAYFTLTGTTTTTPVYRNSELDAPHSDPIVADASGVFPEVFFDPNVELRLRIVDADGDLAEPLIDVDPVTEIITVGGPQLLEGAVVQNLGYTPLNRSGDSITGQVRNRYDNPEFLSFDAIGFRGEPQFIINVDTTLGLQHAGGFIYKDGNLAYTLIIPLDGEVTFPIGTRIRLFNGNDNDITISKDPNVELLMTGDSTFTDQDNLLVVPGEYATLHKLGTDTWLINREGISA